MDEALAGKGQTHFEGGPVSKRRWVGGSAARRASLSCPPGWFWPACGEAVQSCESPGQALLGSLLTSLTACNGAGPSALDVSCTLPAGKLEPPWIFEGSRPIVTRLRFCTHVPGGILTVYRRFAPPFGQADSAGRPCRYAYVQNGCMEFV